MSLAAKSNVSIKDEDFRLIFNRMPNPAFFHDAQFRLILANPAYYELAGVNPEDAIGKQYWEIFPKLGEPLQGCKHAFLSDALASTTEELVIGERAFLSFSYIERNSLGISVYALHILSDVTEQKLSVEKLEKIKSQFEILFDLSPDAIMLVNNNYFFDCNPATLTMFGCQNREQFIGKHPSDFSPEFQSSGLRSTDMANEKIAYALEHGSNLFEWIHCKLDGSEFPAEVLLVAFERNHQKVIQATVRDITLRKQEDLALANTAAKLNMALAGIVTTMSKTMGLRDPYTASHQDKVAKIACQIAAKLGWSADRIQGLKMAALVHDIGKIAIPAEILAKPSALSPFEEKLMQEHPAHSYELLKDIEFPWPIADFVMQHHERLDGSGYPLGLMGEQIALEARVLAVADTLEAMSSHRPYRPAMGFEAAINEIRAQSGIKFDAQVVSAAFALYDGRSDFDL
jgi:PAS domain S-box-containing protein/putative nucleotidyltransferase with HDIG domain